MTVSNQARAKRLTMEGMLATGFVKLGLVPAREGVVIPRGITEEIISFDYGDALRLPPEDVVFSEEGVAATMFIAEKEFRTFVPWTAVYCIASHNGHMAWPEDAPSSMIFMDEDDEPVRTTHHRQRPAWLSVVN